MIYSVSSNKEKFRTTAFKPGFNVVLAERTEDSSTRDSTNGLGKSTLIEIIHFLLGSKKFDKLPVRHLKDWVFNMTLDVGPAKVTVYRAISYPNNIRIKSDNVDFLNKHGKRTLDGDLSLSRDKWSKLLGHYQFGLDINRERNFTPSYRSLISYFVRRNSSRGGFLSPFRQSRQQSDYDMQISNSFLLDLSWEYPSKLHVLNESKKALSQIKKEAESGILSTIFGTLGELESAKVQLESQAKEQQESLEAFKPLPQYHEIENRANELTRSIHELRNSKKEKLLLINLYEKNLTEERDIDPELVTEMYEEAKVKLPELVKKKLYEVQNFQRTLISNRRDFLSSELSRLRLEIDGIEEESKNLELERSELLSVMKTHKALDEYSELVKMKERTTATLEEVKRRITDMRRFEGGKRQLELDLQMLINNASIDLESRERQRELAISYFNQNSKYLYEKSGTLSIQFEKSGLDLKVDIPKDGSTGIDNMKIFCYDLMFSQLWSRKPHTPGFLIHDSVLYDGVDPRQKAKALELAHDESTRSNFQYIVTLNKDAVPYSDFRPNFAFDDDIVIRLKDVSPESSLLGFIIDDMNMK